MKGLFMGSGKSVGLIFSNEDPNWIRFSQYPVRTCEGTEFLLDQEYHIREIPDTTQFILDGDEVSFRISVIGSRDIEIVSAFITNGKELLHIPFENLDPNGRWKSSRMEYLARGVMQDQCEQRERLDAIIAAMAPRMNYPVMMTTTMKKGGTKPPLVQRR